MMHGGVPPRTARGAGGDGLPEGPDSDLYVRALAAIGHVRVYDWLTLRAGHPSTPRHDSVEPSSLFPPAPPAPQSGLAADNIGSRLMQQMGWQRGTGLGRNQTGMVAPIQVELYARGAGLGAAGATAPVPDNTTTYVGATRRAARARYDTAS